MPRALQDDLNVSWGSEGGVGLSVATPATQTAISHNAALTAPSLLGGSFGGWIGPSVALSELREGQLEAEQGGEAGLGDSTMPPLPQSMQAAQGGEGQWGEELPPLSQSLQAGQGGEVVWGGDSALRPSLQPEQEVEHGQAQQELDRAAAFVRGQLHALRSGLSVQQATLEVRGQAHGGCCVDSGCLK